ncbi:hypothetical protein GC170_02250 [bacterium]|nr:hypothetical protein [bacterium]
MKRLQPITFLALCWITLMPAFANSADNIRVMSFNIRFATASDGVNAWQNRKELLLETIRAFAPDLLGTQETLAIQRDFLQQAMIDFEVLAAGRDDGAEKGEMMALFFRKSRFEKLGGGHFWLSETPDSVGSKSWDSSLPRMVTWVKLKDRQNPSALPTAYFNTHFDHRGQQARLESSRLIRRKIAELAPGCRVIVTGDFNTGEGTAPYDAMFATDNDNRPVLIDTFRKSNPARTDAEGTFNGFDPGVINGARIDWIGCSPDFEVLSATIDRTARDGRTPSDHFPITAVLASGAAAASKTKTGFRTLRILSYNIHHGRGMDDKVDLERIARVIRESKPDLVALQEVDRNTTRTAKVDQTAELARLTGLHGTFGKAIDYAGGDYGQAILSRFPIGETKIHWLPGEPDRERRIAFETQVDFEGRKLRFVTTHLHHANDGFRQRQAEKINAIYGDDATLTILAGDLNAYPDSEPLKILKKLWTIANDAPGLVSFPAEKPNRLIDYVIFKPSKGIDVTGQRVIDEPVASDHRPVLVELKFTE